MAPELTINNTHDRERGDHPSLVGTCRTCVNFKLAIDLGAAATGKPAMGSCHAHPPQVSILPTPNGPIALSNFPRPYANWVCGEYHAKLDS